MLKLSVRILTLTLFGTLSFNKWFKNSCFLMCKTGIVNSAHKGVLINKDFKDFVNFTGLATTWGDVVTEVDHITLHVVRTLGEWCTTLYSTIRYSFLWVKLPLFLISMFSQNSTYTISSCSSATFWCVNFGDWCLCWGQELTHVPLGKRRHSIMGQWFSTGTETIRSLKLWLREEQRNRERERPSQGRWPDLASYQR